MSKPRWSPKFYRMVAEIIKYRYMAAGGAITLANAGCMALAYTCHEFDTTFSEDNPKYKQHLFVKACGFTEEDMGMVPGWKIAPRGKAA